MKNSQTHLDTLRWVDLKLSEKVTIWGSAISRNIASFIPTKANSSPLKNDCWKIILSFWNSPSLGDRVRVVLFLGGNFGGYTILWDGIICWSRGLNTKIWHPTIRKFWSEVYSHLFFFGKRVYLEVHSFFTKFPYLRQKKLIFESRFFETKSLQIATLPVLFVASSLFVQRKNTTRRVCALGCACHRNHSPQCIGEMNEAPLNMLNKTSLPKKKIMLPCS